MRGMTAHHQTFDAAVIGGGLVGKTAALALTQGGLRVALLAQPCAPLPAGATFDSRVYALSVQFAGAAGAAAGLAGARYRRASARSTTCASTATPTPNSISRRFRRPCRSWRGSSESSLIERALDAALRFQPNLDVDRHARSRRSTSTPTARRIGLANGKVLEADLVVGADGAHSWVRAQIGSKVIRRDYKQTGVVANFKAEKPHGETAYQWFKDGEIIALLPLPDGHVSLVWSARTEHADATARARSGATRRGSRTRDAAARSARSTA